MTDETPGFIVKHRGAIGTARAMFMCNSKTCRTKKGARQYELPTATTRCPVCGSKKIVKLMNPPNISRGIAKRSDAFVEPVYKEKKEMKDRAKEAQRQAPMLAVPNDGNLASAVSRAMGIPIGGMIGQPGKAKPTLGITSPDLAGVKAAGMTSVKPTSVRRWNPDAKDIAAARRAT
jgi:hypothetical protein